jgi:hypothetical protein
MGNSSAEMYASRAKRAAQSAQTNYKEYADRSLAEAVENLAKAVAELARKQ